VRQQAKSRWNKKGVLNEPFTGISELIVRAAEVFRTICAPSLIFPEIPLFFRKFSGKSSRESIKECSL